MIQLAGIPLRIGFRLPETAKYYSRFLLQEDCPEYDIAITEEDIDTYPEQCADGVLHPYDEHYMLIARASQFLLKRHRVLIHGVAFVWKGKAWLITAPSGTGKTTQLRHWCTCFSEEVQVLNGDKPLLECREDGSVWVHSSPWRGKEKLGMPDLHAPLAGIILLERGNHNEMVRLTREEAVLPLFIEFVAYPENEEQIRGQEQILRQILDAVPVWKLINLGDEESAKLTQKTLQSWLEGER